MSESEEEEQEEQDTVLISNLPECFTTEALEEWCDSNFSVMPIRVEVHRRCAKTAGFLVFADASTAAATLELFRDDDDPFLVEGRRVTATWAELDAYPTPHYYNEKKDTCVCEWPLSGAADEQVCWYVSECVERVVQVALG
jgi:hypothetical protein